MKATVWVKRIDGKSERDVDKDRSKKDASSLSEGSKSIAVFPEDGTDVSRPMQIIIVSLVGRTFTSLSC